jgi:hypothetical protein
MSDPSFESRLERLYSQPPQVAEPEAFAARVQARLDREWSLRRGLIGAAGLIGGVIAATQTVGAQTYAQFAAALGPARRSLDTAWAQAWSAELPTQALLNGEAMWMIAALGGMALTLAAARAADAF